ncbi:hypothetical protein OK016_27215 [Vibrio chagasii]|nr:hypothetical protein [Vibrio chagasii]
MSGEDKIITRPYLASTGDQAMSLATPIYNKVRLCRRCCSKHPG